MASQKVVQGNNKISQKYSKMGLENVKISQYVVKEKQSQSNKSQSKNLGFQNALLNYKDVAASSQIILCEQEKSSIHRPFCGNLYLDCLIISDDITLAQLLLLIPSLNQCVDPSWH